MRLRANLERVFKIASRPEIAIETGLEFEDRFFVQGSRSEVRLIQLVWGTICWTAGCAAFNIREGNIVAEHK